MDTTNNKRYGAEIWERAMHLVLEQQGKYALKLRRYWLCIPPQVSTIQK